MTKFLTLLFFIFLLSCKSRVEKEYINNYFGKYCTKRLPLIKRIKQEIKYKKSYLLGSVVYMLYLREDSSFVTSSCNQQIHLAGKYSISKDSINFFDVYNFYRKHKVPNYGYSANWAINQVYMERKQMKTSKSRFSKSVTVLLKNHFGVHTGFARNENMPLDSLLEYNKWWDHKKQMDWFYHSDKYLEHQKNKK